MTAKTPLDSAILPASVYSRTHNLAAVSVLVVLTWSQAAPAGPLLHLEAIKVPPQFHYTLGSHEGSSWKQSPPLCSHGELTLNGSLHCLINTKTCS